MNQFLTAFKQQVKIKYELYNSLFLTLPFEGVDNAGILLPLFSKACEEGLKNNQSPEEIVDAFFQDHGQIQNKKNNLLFKFLQFVERQIVLFDSLEDAAFNQINDRLGEGTMQAFLLQVRLGKKEAELKKVLNDFKVRVVLTAHPTQFYSKNILSIIKDLSKAINKNDLGMIYNLLLQMGKTSFRNKQKPTPINEAQTLIWYLKNIFYQVVPRLHKNLLMESNQGIESFSSPIIEFGFWPGGDRDGNPFVTFKTTQRVAFLLKKSIIKLYLKDLNVLMRRLTFEGVFDLLKEIQLKLFALLNQKTAYKKVDDFLSDLKRVRSLLKKEHNSLFLNFVDELIIKVSIFGFYFASIDLRQDSRVLEKVLEDVLKHAFGENILLEYHALDEKKKKFFLIDLLKSFKGGLFVKKIDYGYELTEETLLSMKEAFYIQNQNGLRGLNRYIISNTQSDLDLFEVLFLLHFCKEKESKGILLDIVPLFETIDDLKNAPKIMENLYQNEFYKKHLEFRDHCQTIMVGFSDGTKDGGYVAANWSIFQAKENLTNLSRTYGIKIIFFDGRGGPPARGGGNTYKFYRAFGDQIEDKQIQLTIQGQTISSNFGSFSSCYFNLEQLLCAGLENRLFDKDKKAFNEKEKKIMTQLSNHCLKHYLSFRGDPLFVDYLEQKTPLSYYSKLNIASRPASRQQSKKLNFEHLRAIPFVGAWSQMKQNIPGFFGFGWGIEAIEKEGLFDLLKNLYQKSLFFKTLVENSMQSLKKTFFPLTAYLKNDKIFHAFWEKIFAESMLSKKNLKKISSMKKLLEQNEVIRESIELREKIVLPLLVIQQYALIKSKKETGDKQLLGIYEKMIIKSLAANINASRNSV